MPTIDVNADLGEGFGRWTLGDDAAMMALISSANIACGFHAGDPLTLRRTVRAAAAAGVTIGAQVGYRDLVGFGRRFIDVAPDDLAADVLYQIGALEGLCRAEGTTVRYVKPHGALFHAVMRDPGQAAAVVAAVADWSPGCAVLGLPGSVFLDLATDAGLRPVTEAFADRAYLPTGGLVPRTEPGAILTDLGEIAARVVDLAVNSRVIAIDGTVVPLAADSLCLHGDTPGAVAHARVVRAALAEARVAAAPFA